MAKMEPVTMAMTAIQQSISIMGKKAFMKLKVNTEKMMRIIAYTNVFAAAVEMITLTAEGA